MQLKRIKLTLFFLLCFTITGSAGQSDSIVLAGNDSVTNKKRLFFITGTEAILYTGSLCALNELWYKDYPRSSFHFFNDNKEWLQMDKVGHITTSYYIGRVGIGLFKWAGMERKKAIWYGGMLGSVYQTTIEILDAYSANWGFSIGDFAANTSGSFLVVAQELLWNEQRMVLKYSFQQSKFAHYRPNLLGSNLKENILKDYNGQTYWLSVNPASFMRKQHFFPRWLNVAIGYGAEGMTGGMQNPLIMDQEGQALDFERYRQWYVSLDIDLTRIKTRSVFLKTLFTTIGFVKIPCPALELDKRGIRGNWIGF